GRHQRRPHPTELNTQSITLHSDSLTGSGVTRRTRSRVVTFLAAPVAAELTASAASTAPSHTVCAAPWVVETADRATPDTPPATALAVPTAASPPVRPAVTTAPPTAVAAPVTDFTVAVMNALVTCAVPVATVRATIAPAFAAA